MDEFAREVTRPVRKPDAYAKVWADGVDSVWAIDLADMVDVVGNNDGFRYIMCIVDVFSRYAWCVPLKNKDAKTSWDAFARVMRSSESHPQSLWADQGSEFYNSIWTTNFKRLKIHRYSTFGDYKVSIAERFIRTLKHHIWFEFVRDNTRKWIDKLDDIVATYNNTVHSAIGMTPTEARKPENEEKLLSQIPKRKFERPKYKLNQWVRIHRKKTTFEKGFTPSYSFEMFKIVQIRMSHPVRYYLVDYYGEPIHGSFYETDLVPVSDPSFFPVEKVLKRRTVKGQQEALVKFMGYKLPVWRPASELEDVAHGEAIR